MKGIIFTTLAEMVEENFGLELWDQVLLDAKPASELTDPLIFLKNPVINHCVI